VTSLLAGILALSFLIIIHEFGHFVAARAAGMHVDRFSVFGIGAPIFSFGTFKGTEYVISAVPFGAYVHIVGMEVADDEIAGASEVPPGRINYRDAPLFGRMLAILGGPLANYFAAMAIVATIYATVGTQVVTGIRVASFDEGSPAQAAGLLEGDRFVAVLDQDLSGPSAAQTLNQTTAKHLGEVVPVRVERNGEVLAFDVKLNEQAPALQTRLQIIGEWQDMPLDQAVSEGVKWPIVKTVENLTMIARMIVGEQKGSLSGPIGIVDQLRQSANAGFLTFMMFTALISTVVGMTNLLPLPALDGGRMVFLVYEAVVRRPFNRLLEEKIHGFGMLLLMGLLLLITGDEIITYTKGIFVSDDASAQEEGKDVPPNEAAPEAAPAK
jgi:regulator of sigma E protease